MAEETREQEENESEGKEECRIQGADRRNFGKKFPKAENDKQDKVGRCRGFNLANE